MMISNIQTAYKDGFARNFAGDLLNPASLDGNRCFSAPVAASNTVFVGRGVASTTLVDGQNIPNGIALVAPTATTTADDFAGIVMSDKGALDDGNGNNYIQEKRCATYARAGRGAIIAVKIKSGVTVLAGDTVWMAVDTGNTAGIEIGEFTNAADAGAGTGMVELPFNFFKGNDVGEIAYIELYEIKTAAAADDE